MSHLVSASILSRLDYCNAVLAGLPWSTVAPLQRVQNAAARLVLGLPPRDYASSAPKEIHWLPVHYRIQLMLALLMFKAYIGQCPLYIRDAVALTSQNTCRYPLSSADTTDYIVPRTRTEFWGESILCCWTDCLELSP